MIFLTCAGLLLGMMVISGATLEQAYPDLPHESDVVDDPETYVGETVLLEGRVVDVDPVVIAVSTGEGTRRFTLAGTSQAIKPGAYVEVYGTLEDPDTIRVIEAVAITDEGLWYAYLISVIGVVWVLVRLFRHWRFDRQAWGLRPQTGVTEEETATPTQEEPRDA